jgi:hypothetical protein
MWGVSDPLCHPPEAAPDPSGRGSLTPHLVRTKMTARRDEERCWYSGKERASSRSSSGQVLRNHSALRETFNAGAASSAIILIA